MNRLKVIGVTWLAVGATLLFLFGCASTRGGAGVTWGESDRHSEVGTAPKQGPPPHAPAHGYRAKHRYRYYPAREVYYDTGRRIYFYIENDVWTSDALLPYHLRVSLGHYETVEMYSETPYDYHEYTYKKQHKVPPGQSKKKGGWGK